MADLLLDANGDLDTSNHRISLVTGAASVRQAMLARFRTTLGEWFLDQRVGVPYFSNAFIKNPDLSLLRTMFTTVALGTSGVASVESVGLDLDRSTRRMTVTIRGTIDPGVADGTFEFTFTDLILDLEGGS